MCLPVKPYRLEREWKHAGLSCAITLTRDHGHRCGYVRLPPGHPAHGKDFETVPEEVDANVHGGITFTELEPCTDHDDGQGWWLGFDFAHSFDAHDEPGFEPDYLRGYRELSGGHYWTEAEVAAECERLAEQLAEMMT